MNTKIIQKFIAIFTLAAFLASAAGIQSVSASGPTVSANRPDASEQVLIQFYELGMDSPVSLDGPVSEYALSFNLPGGWIPEGQAELSLPITAFFSSLVMPEETGAVSGMVAGQLEVYLNDMLVQMFTLQQSGDQDLSVAFDAGELYLARDNRINTLRFRWNGESSCRQNLLTSVLISPESTLNLVYSTGNPEISLNRFPVPFIINRPLQPVPVTLVLPDDPSQPEMRAAMIVMAGVGQISGGQQEVSIDSVSGYTSAQGTANILLVAETGNLQEVKPAMSGKMTPVEAGQGEGLLQLFEPTKGSYGLVISGDSEGIIKAAQAFASGRVVDTTGNNAMLVSRVDPPAELFNLEDMTLADLGAGDVLLSHSNGITRSFEFYVPPGMQARADSYFGLVPSHSQQLDYLSSGLQVTLNGSPIASLRLNDNTSNPNLFQLILPVSLIHAGRNNIELTANLTLLDMCSAMDTEQAWLRVASDSLLHLPLEKVANTTASPATFKDFPSMFLSGSRLGNVLLLLSRGDAGVLQSAGTVAYDLGLSFNQADLLELQADWADAYDPATAEMAHLALIGNPQDFPMISAEGFFPALVFDPGNTLSPESRLEYVADTGRLQDTGYLVIRKTGADTGRIILGVLGSSSAGTANAAGMLTAPDLRDINFAVITSEGIQTGWLDQAIATGRTMEELAQQQVTEGPSNAARMFKAGLITWGLPVIAIMLTLFISMLLIEIRYKTGKRATKENATNK